MRPSCAARLTLLLSLVPTESFRVPHATHSPLHARQFQSRSGVSMPEEGVVSDDASVELNSGERVGDPLEQATDGKVWKVKASETGPGYEGPYTTITECRRILAEMAPTSIWRFKTARFQMEAVLDIPADLVWEGVTNNCSQPHKVNVYYPVGTSGPVPLVSYAHGKNNGGWKLDPSERSRIFQPLVEQGFFVVAYQHGGTGGYCSEMHNQMGQIEWLKTSQFASMIDFSRIGVMGHSMGGKATFRSTTSGNNDIKVAVTINAHCVSDCTIPTVPTLMISGNLDTTARPEQQRSMFNRMTVPGAFAGFAFGHGFNAEWSRLALQPLFIGMLRCYLYHDAEDCSEINQQYSPFANFCFGKLWWTAKADIYRDVGWPEVGHWGGKCRCPSGEIYEVGDNYDSCGSLACAGGEVVEACGEGVIRPKKSGWGVTCGDHYEYVGEPVVGQWGGKCRCPSGTIYEVGDNYDSCGSLACIGGEVVEACGEDVISPYRAGMRVTCVPA